MGGCMRQNNEWKTIRATRTIANDQAVRSHLDVIYTLEK